jgi:hypothetical protein
MRDHEKGASEQGAHRVVVGVVVPCAIAPAGMAGAWYRCNWVA